MDLALYMMELYNVCINIKEQSFPKISTFYFQVHTHYLAHGHKQYMDIEMTSET